MLQITSITTRPETREQWLNAFANAARPQFEELGSPLPETIRMSVGFPSQGQRSNVIGQCWYPEATEDKVCEIFIRPSLQSDSRRIAGVLTHELVHAAGHKGHGADFAKVAKGLGLGGKMTATIETDDFYAWADPLIEELGPFPGAALDGMQLAGGKKKQGTRMIKMVCGDCDWSFRTAQKNIDAMTDHTCLACGEGQLGVE
jgi:hypothetical protein